MATSILYHINKLLWPQRQPMQPGLSHTCASQGRVKRGGQCGCPSVQREGKSAREALSQRELSTGCKGEVSPVACTGDGRRALLQVVIVHQDYWPMSLQLLH